MSHSTAYKHMDQDIMIQRGAENCQRIAVDDGLPSESLLVEDAVTSTLEIRNYWRNPFLVTESVLCVLFGILGHFAPSAIFRLQLYEREIPYQVTANQDIILDQYINRPLVDKETIPDWSLLLLSFVAPLIILTVYGTMSIIKNDLHSSVCALFFSMGCCQFITSFVKLYVGYFRPNFYEYCEFSENSLECGMSDFNPRKSFPSGHASSSFCSMTLLTLFFYGKVGLHGIIKRRGVTIGLLMKKRCLSIASALPLMLAIFIAVSRIHDDMHHPADVVAGAVIGMSCAVFAHGLWYSSVYSPLAGEPLLNQMNETH